MIYEICAVIMIFIILIIWLINPIKIIYKKYGGKSLDFNKQHIDDDKMMIVILFGCAFVIWEIIMIMFMFWTSAQGIIWAKYYALFLLFIIIISIIKSKLKGELKVLPKKQPTSAVIYSTITTLVTLALIIWALVI